jgi:hypothetical protein
VILIDNIQLIRDRFRKHLGFFLLVKVWEKFENFIDFQ